MFSFWLKIFSFPFGQDNFCFPSGRENFVFLLVQKISFPSISIRRSRNFFSLRPIKFGFPFGQEHRFSFWPRKYNFFFWSKFLRQYETKPDSWHAAALHGHSLGKTLFITEPARRVLKEMQLFSVSRIFETNDNMTTSEEEKIELFEHLDQHHPSLSNKLKWIRRNLRDTRITRTHAYPTSFTTGQAQIQQDSKLSIKYRKQARQDLDASIGTVPAYATRLCLSQSKNLH